MPRPRLALLLSPLLFCSACAINHNVAQTYPQTLAKHGSNLASKKAPFKASYRLTKEAAEASYDMKSGIHHWIVDFGVMLDDYIRSDEVQDAFDGLPEAKEGDKGNVLVFDIEYLSVESEACHFDLNVTLLKNGKKAFSKTYKADGRDQKAKAFLMGVINAIHWSATTLLNKVFQELVDDLKAL